MVASKAKSFFPWFVQAYKYLPDLAALRIFVRFPWPLRSLLSERCPNSFRWKSSPIRKYCVFVEETFWEEVSEVWVSVFWLCLFCNSSSTVCCGGVESISCSCVEGSSLWDSSCGFGCFSFLLCNNAKYAASSISSLVTVVLP